MQLIKKTRLETAIESGDSIATILDNKIEQARNNNLPVEETVADYIALGIGSQKAKIEQYKQYKKDLDAAIKELEELESQTEMEVFEWMEANGLEKLKGIHCSSVTIKPACVSVRNKIVRDISDSELLDKGLAHYEETISDIPASIKINKRREK